MVDFNEILSFLEPQLPAFSARGIYVMQKKRRNSTEVSLEIATESEFLLPELPLPAYPLPEFSLNKDETLALRTAIMLKLFRKTEAQYAEQMRHDLFISTQDSSIPFWKLFRQKIYALMSFSLKTVFHTLDLPIALKIDFLLHQISHLETQCTKFVDGIFFMSHLTTLCQRHECLFLRHFDQKNHPNFYLQGPQCIGVIFDWGQQLWRNPPTSSGTSSPLLIRYYKFLSKLKIGEFPTELLAVDTLIGDQNHLNKNTLFFQKNCSQFLDIAGPPAIDSPRLTGEKLMTSALQLFKKPKHTPTQKVRILEATLIGKTDTTDPHMIGIAKINLGTSSIYRFADAEGGEFEANCPRKLGTLLQEYFTLYGYTLRYSGFTLRCIDTALMKLTEKMRPKTHTVTTAAQPSRAPLLSAYKTYLHKPTKIQKSQRFATVVPPCEKSLRRHFTSSFNKTALSHPASLPIAETVPLHRTSKFFI